MTELTEKIVAEIRNTGPMRLSRFMDLALYCPVYGYYEKEADNPGRAGDYYTSVSVGRVFGELLAWQFFHWTRAAAQAPSREKGCQTHGEMTIEPQPAPGPDEAVQLIEAGAGAGQLARDILGWLRERCPEFFERVEYRIVEPSERRREWQRRHLEEFGVRVGWVPDLGALNPAEERFRLIFSNELLDAFPVRRLGWDAREQEWFEWGVGLEGGRLEWERMAGKVENAPDVGALGAVLPDGFIIDWCPAATEWWRRAACLLRRGKLLTFDYGLTVEEIFSPRRPHGTLRAYRRHLASADVLAEPGERDITAHVNFTDLQLAGEAAGLRTEHFETQARFLTQIVARLMQGGTCFGEWTASHTRQFQTLTHPEHLGRAFRVLVQGRTSSGQTRMNAI